MFQSTMFYFSGMTISLSKHVPEVSTADNAGLFWDKNSPVEYFFEFCDVNFSFPIFSQVSAFLGRKNHF